MEEKFYLNIERKDKNTCYKDIYKFVGRDFLLLEELVVEPQYMGKGYGKQGLKKALEIAKKENLPLVFQPYPLRIKNKDYCGNKEVDLFNKKEVEEAINSLLQGFYIPVLRKEGYKFKIKKLGEFKLLTVVVYP